MAPTNEEQLHVVFLPYNAPGHMMPMVDVARLFAAQPNVKATIITTPLNAQRFQAAVDADVKFGRNISFDILPFPTPTESGLPEGCENLIDAPSPETTLKLIRVVESLKPEMETRIRRLHPDCIASDILFHWTTDLGTELGIPRIGFSGSCFFNLCVTYCVENYQPHKDIESETEPFIVPNLPDRVLLTRSQLPDIVKAKNEFSALFDKMKEAERNSFGTMVNSFRELEGAYADHYRKTIGIEGWQIGPVSLFNKDEKEKAGRGDKTSVGSKSCIDWLDLQKPRSVLYVCFGSLTRLSKAQSTEIASALENTGHSFVWVVGKILEAERGGGGAEYWLPEGFEERVKEFNKGMIIKGWAPQLLILEHQAIGGFMTHCGWNSILEGVAAGVPMLTWPLFAEQFYNEKLVTQVLRFGVPVGNEVWKLWETVEMEFIVREKIEKVVRKVMDEGKEAEEMRKIVSQLGEGARNAVREGGSSSNELKALIKGIRLKVQK